VGTGSSVELVPPPLQASGGGTALTPVLYVSRVREATANPRNVRVRVHEATASRWLLFSPLLGVKNFF